MPDVSMIRSASPFSDSIISRSLRMPSITRSPGASGWRRRVASNRRTRSSSDASRNTIRHGIDRSRRSSSARDSSAKNTPPRTSTTIATRRGPPAAVASSAIFPMSAGGRLSTTKYPRSSKLFAASDRPAPDRPVMMVTSGDVARLGPGDLAVAARRPPPRSPGLPRGASAPCRWSWIVRARAGPTPGTARSSSTLGRPEAASASRSASAAPSSAWRPRRGCRRAASAALARPASAGGR